MNKRQAAFNFFVGKGWSYSQAAGIVANLEAESGLREDADGDGGKAYGIAQWHFPRPGHLVRGTSFEAQLQFVQDELSGTEHHAAMELAACTTAEAAAEVICRYYERPADPDGDSRKRAALATVIFDEARANPPPELAPAPDPYIPPVEIAPAPATVVNQEEPIMGLLAALLPSILSLFAPRAQAAISKVTGQPADVSNAFLADLFNKIQAATGKADPVQATAALQQAHPETIKAVEDHALEYLDKLAPVLEKLAQYDKQAWDASEESTERAAARALQQQQAEGGPFANPTFLIAMVVLGLVAMVVVAVLFLNAADGKPRFSTDMQALVIGTVVSTAFATVLAFYFGSSRNSAAKDATIGAIAQGKSSGTGNGK